MSRVKDVMGKTRVSLKEDTPFKEIVRLMDAFRASALPVTDPSGRLLGVVSEAELLRKEAGEGARGRWLKRTAAPIAETTTAGKIMQTGAPSVGPDSSLRDAARTMYERRVVRLPVVDEDERMLGMLTWLDLLEVFLRSDEDIRSEIERWIRDAALSEPFSVSVTVRDGVATLLGELETRSQTEPLLGFVRSMDGVVGVVDRLTFAAETPSGSTVPTGPARLRAP